MADQPRTRNVERIRALARRVASVDEASPFAKVGVYGPNGAGKTRFAASAPKCLIIDVNEEGTRSAKGSGAKRIVISEWEEIADAYWYFSAMLEKGRYESVAIDPLSSLQHMCMQFVLGDAEKKNTSRATGMPDKQSYGRTGMLMRDQILVWRNLPCHVVFTCRERAILDEDTMEVTSVTADLPASSRGTFLDSVGVLGYMDPRPVKVKADGKQRTVWRDQLICGRHQLYRTKDRTNLLGPVLEQPTMSKVIAAWNTTEEN